MTNKRIIDIETFIEILKFNVGASILIEVHSDNWGCCNSYNNTEIGFTDELFHITGWNKKDKQMETGGEFKFKFSNIKEIGYIPDKSKLQRFIYFISKDGFRFNLILDKGFVRE